MLTQPDSFCLYMLAGADGEDGLCFCLQVLMVKMVCVFTCLQVLMVCFYVFAGADGEDGLFLCACRC